MRMQRVTIWARRLDWPRLLTFCLLVFALFFGVLHAEMTLWRGGLLLAIMLLALGAMTRRVRRRGAGDSISPGQPQPAPPHGTADRQLLHAIFEYSLEGIIMTDIQGTILRVNPSYSRITGYTADECIGKNPRLLHSGFHDQIFYAGMWNTLTQTGEWEGEIWDRRKSGEAYPQWLRISAVRSEQGDPGQCGAHGSRS